MTPLGIGKSVIQTECHNNQSFLVQEGPFWDQKLSYKAIVILSEEQRIILVKNECQL